MHQPRNLTSKYDKESEDEQLVSNINIIDKALHGNRDPLLKDPIWARQNEINKSMFAKVDQIDQIQAASLESQQSLKEAVTADFLKLRNAVLENSAEGDAALERFRKEQTRLNADVVARTKTLANELATTSTVLESNVRTVDSLREAQLAVRSELSDVVKEKTSLEIRLDSMEALLKDVSERLSEMFIKMETMGQEIETLQEDAGNESSGEGQ